MVDLLSTKFRWFRSSCSGPSPNPSGLGIPDWVWSLAKVLVVSCYFVSEKCYWDNFEQVQKQKRQSRLRTNKNPPPKIQKQNEGCRENRTSWGEISRNAIIFVKRKLCHSQLPTQSKRQPTTKTNTRELSGGPKTLCNAVRNVRG